MRQPSLSVQLSVERAGTFTRANSKFQAPTPLARKFQAPNPKSQMGAGVDWDFWICLEAGAWNLGFPPEAAWGA
jgi:hypothetical protein